jgi:hypothetical protein
METYSLIGTSPHDHGGGDVNIDPTRKRWPADGREYQRTERFAMVIAYKLGHVASDPSSSSTIRMVRSEQIVLEELRAGGVAGNIPQFVGYYQCEAFSALMLSPIGWPSLPCRIDIEVTPVMMVTLLRVI